MMNDQQHQQGPNIKRCSKWFLALTLIFTATFTLHAEDSEAARRKQVRQVRQVRKMPAPRSAKLRKVVKHNNPSGVYALYQNAHFGYAKCLPKLTEPTQRVLNRNGIRTFGANEKEKTALARGIAQVERLLGRPLPENYRYHYQWIYASGAWNSGLTKAGFVTLKRPKDSPKGTLTGRMMHELGHRFGHADSGKLYNEYRSHMRGKKCVVSTYCLKNLNEEFAEAFEAYIVNPDFLAKHCPDSFAFFKNKVFRNSSALLASCEDPNSILDQDVDDEDDASEQHDEEEIDANPNFMKLPETGPIPVMDPRKLEPIVTQDGSVITQPVTVISVETAQTQGAEAAQQQPATSTTTATEEAAKATISTETSQAAVPADNSAQDSEWKAHIPAEGVKIPVPVPRPQK